MHAKKLEMGRRFFYQVGLVQQTALHVCSSHPETEGYEDSIRHYVVSSSYPSHAAVQPSTTKGLVKIVRIPHNHQQACPVHPHGIARCNQETQGSFLGVPWFPNAKRVL